MDSVSPTLIDDLCSPDPARVAAALQAAAPHRETLGPVLLARLSEAAANPTEWIAREDSPSPIFLCYLAAAWRLTEAHPLLAALLRLPPRQCEALLDDFITEGAQLVLADTWPENLHAIEALALDRAADSFARTAALGAVAQLTARGTLPREDALAFFTRIAAAPMDPDHDDDVQFASELVCTLMDLRAWELRGTVTQLLEGNLVDPGYAGDDDEVLGKLEPGAIFNPAPDRFSPPITDAWAAVSQWCFFDPLYPDRAQWALPPTDPDSEPAPLPPGTDSWKPRQPYIAPPKVGRNDPCPCGSGKKHKKCCGG